MKRRWLVAISGGVVLLVTAAVILVLKPPNGSSRPDTTAITPEPGDNKMIVSVLLPRMSLEELIQNVDAIVVATVVEIMPARWNNDVASENNTIYRDVILQAAQYLFGAPKSERLAIRVDGGRIDNTTMIAEDEPVFVQGESCLLFLVRQTGMTPVPSGIDSLAYYRVALLRMGKWVYSDGVVTDTEGNSYSISLIREKIEALR